MGRHKLKRQLSGTPSKAVIAKHVFFQSPLTDHVVVSCSLPMSCIMTDIEVRDKVEVLACSSVQLRANWNTR